MKKLTYIVFASALAIGMGACQHEPLIPESPIDPNGGGGGGGGEPCEPGVVYFENDVWPIIQSSCAYTGCHGGGSAQDGIDLSSYQAMMNSDVITAFSLGGSELYEVITENDPDKVMPPPPNAELTQEQIDLISAWIQQGALNNSCDSECDLLDVTFSGTVQPIIQQSCQGCHSGASPQGGISLTNYTQIQGFANSGALYGTVSHAAGYTAMPYNQPQLDDCKVEQIRLWVEAGAPNN